MAEIIIKSVEQFDKVIESGVTLVDFWATWCGPCRMLAPTIEKVALAVEGKAKVAKVDVDEVEALADRFSIMSIPTLIVFKDGKLMEKSMGVRGESQIIASIEKHI